MSLATVDDSSYLTSKWWILTMQGILAILFGIAFVFWPGLSLVTLVYLFGGYILAAGILSIIEGLLSIGKGKGGSWIFTLLLGIVQLGVGVYLLRNPEVSFGVLILLIGLSLIAFAVLEIIATFASGPTSATNRALSIVGALLAGVAGIVVLFQPEASGVAFVWILGLFSLISGPILIALSLDVKHLNEQLETVK